MSTISRLPLFCNLAPDYPKRGSREIGWVYFRYFRGYWGSREIFEEFLRGLLRLPPWISTAFRPKLRSPTSSNLIWSWKSWKVLGTGRVFGLSDNVSACMTWRCLETSRTLSFCLVSAQSLMYIKALRPSAKKNNANYLVYSNCKEHTKIVWLRTGLKVKIKCCVMKGMV